MVKIGQKGSQIVCRGHMGQIIHRCSDFKKKHFDYKVNKKVAKEFAKNSMKLFGLLALRNILKKLLLKAFIIFRWSVLSSLFPFIFVDVLD